MKIYKYTKVAGLAAIISIGLSACSDFLTEDSKTALSEEKIYSDIDFVESNLQSIYKGWRGLFTDRWLWEQMVGTDEIQSGAFQALKEDGMKRGALDRYDALLNSELSYPKEQWNDRWPRVSESAKIIQAIEKNGEITPNSKTAKLYGEACFIRGGMSMELAMLFGRIPILDMDRIGTLGYRRRFKSSSGSPRALSPHSRSSLNTSPKSSSRLL